MLEIPSDARDTKRFSAIIHGRVQGVSFRYYAQQKAQTLGLAGHVRNHWDGTVQVVAQGSSPALQALLAWLHRGPSLALVQRVNVTWQAPCEELRSFEVRY